MSLRSKIGFDIQVGAENSLDSLVFQRAIEESLDTMDKHVAITGDLAASESVPLDKGDITTIHFIYVEGDGDIDVFLGGAAATTAVVTGVGGAYPSGFVGGEYLDLEIDSVAFRTTFLSTDSTLADVVNRINAAAAFAGLSGLVASDSLGELRITSLTAGTASIVNVVGWNTGSTPAVGSLTAVTEALTLDGETFTLDDGVNPPVTYEFDKGGGVAVGNVAVDITADTTAIDVADRMIRVINQTLLLDLTAANANGTTALVTLTNDTDGPAGNVVTWADTVANAGFLIVQPVGGTASNVLGLTAASVAGLDPTPAQAPMALRQMGDTSNPSAVETLKAYLLVTAKTTSVTITNPDTANAVRYRVLLLGDLVDPADDC